MGMKDLNPDIRGPTGQTALEVAASWKHARVVKILSQLKHSHPLPRNPASKPSERYRGSRGLSRPGCGARLRKAPPGVRAFMVFAIILFIGPLAIIFVL